MDEEKKALLDKKHKLAHEIITISRNSLLVNFRFLDLAISQFSYAEYEGTIATDGRLFLYDVSHILKIYKQEQSLPVRAFLHMVFHCVFRHMYLSAEVDRECWDLACDIAVESLIGSMDVSTVKTKKDAVAERYLKEIKEACPVLTAEKIYRYLMDSKKSKIEIASLRGVVYHDDHTFWYMSPEEKKDVLMNNPGFKMLDGQSFPSPADGSPQQRDGNGEAERWKEISEKIQIALETGNFGIGTQKGTLFKDLEQLNRERYDYTEFLKKFAVMGEVMKVNDDEFDYVYYTYGLELYGRMPLIEPLEYKEEKRIKDFVIAIDTSGSVGVGTPSLVHRFIQKTFNILKSSESFFSKVNIHIIQCDADIQEHVKITSQEEFDAYIKKMKIRGMGGTDFVPVFRKVNELVEQGEFTNLKGLICFTDGWGTFPSKKPDYETAFVFVRDFQNNESVPPWAIKLVVDEDEI